MNDQEPDKPQVGRVYDYVLGGDRHFPVDRQAAARIMEVLPAYPIWARLNRQFLSWVAKQWVQAGHTSVLDLGSGLPTNGHFHTLMPAATILYSDSDAFCVEHGRELTVEFPRVTYMQADLRHPQQVIDIADHYLDRTQATAIGCIGVAYLLSDDQLVALTQRLHAWSAPGSVMALSFLEREDSPAGAAFASALQQRLSLMNITTYYRTPEQLKALLQPWRMVAAQPLESWVGQQDSITTNERVDDLFWMSGALFSHD